VRLDIVGTQRERAVEAFQRLVVAAENAQRRAVVVVRLGVIGLKGERLAERFERLLVAASAAIVVRFREFRFLLQRLVEAFERFLVALERIEDHTIVEQDLRRRLAAAHRRRHQLQCLGRLALGNLDQPHHLQGVEMIGAGSENFGVERLGPASRPLWWNCSACVSACATLKGGALGSGGGISAMIQRREVEKYVSRPDGNAAAAQKTCAAASV
jgi:hypothetical protein